MGCIVFSAIFAAAFGVLKHTVRGQFQLQIYTNTNLVIPISRLRA
jgi:hypothetical protein